MTGPSRLHVLPEAPHGFVKYPFRAAQLAREAQRRFLTASILK